MTPTPQDRAVWAAEADFEREASYLHATAALAACDLGLPSWVRNDLQACVDRFKAARTALRDARWAQQEARRAP